MIGNNILSKNLWSPGWLPRTWPLSGSRTRTTASDWGPRSQSWVFQMECLTNLAWPWRNGGELLIDFLGYFEEETKSLWIWRFSQLRLVEHLATLKKQGFLTVDQVIKYNPKSHLKFTSYSQVLSINIENLEDLGIVKLGHQKRLMLAIKKAKLRKKSLPKSRKV